MKRFVIGMRGRCGRAIATDVGARVETMDRIGRREGPGC